MGTIPADVAKLWQGVRMHTALAASEPDAPPRPVTLPASWPESAAAALAALLPGEAPVALATAAQDWLRSCAKAGGPDLARRLQAMLLAQRCAPGAAAWRGMSDLAPGAILNVSAFHEPELGYDHAALAMAVDDAAAMNAALAPGRRTCLGLSGLAGAIAAAGLDYDSDAARALAVAVVGAVRVRLQARAAQTGMPALLVVAGPGPVDALLGIEAAGIAPAFSPLATEGGLSRAARALLAARGLSAEAALAATLAGQSPFAATGATALAAMHATLAPLLDALPALALPLPAAAPPSRPLPSRRGGFAQKVGMGGHRLFLQTGEYADGRIGELAITLPKEAPAVRALADCLAQAVSIGLQHGVPLAAFVEALAGTRFAPSGTVEGDDSVTRASSLVDYVFRKLAATYLPELALPELALPEDAPDVPPLLPLDLPQDPALRPRPRTLKVVR